MLDLITILGPTASGKTTLAVALAAHLDTEIISADSRQIYRSMDIGTGKDLSEYTVEGKTIPYHLIDICPPGYKYNLFEYIRDYNIAYADIVGRGKTPILCGGTGLYLEAVLKGYSLPPVPENKALRESLAQKSLPELEAILKSYKTLHNQTDTDTCNRNPYLNSCYKEIHILQSFQCQFSIDITIFGKLFYLCSSCSDNSKFGRYKKAIHK